MNILRIQAGAVKGANLRNADLRVVRYAVCPIDQDRTHQKQVNEEES